MKKQVIAFHKDSENHWVADLKCGHSQHMRHDPPWTERLWVTTPEGRADFIGTCLNCARCDEAALKIAKAVQEACRNVLLENYNDAGMAGLCLEGRWEAAVNSLKDLPLLKIAEDALS